MVYPLERVVRGSLPAMYAALNLDYSSVAVAEDNKL